MLWFCLAGSRGETDEWGARLERVLLQSEPLWLGQVDKEHLVWCHILSNQLYFNQTFNIKWNERISCLSPSVLHYLQTVAKCFPMQTSQIQSQSPSPRSGYLHTSGGVKQCSPLDGRSSLTFNECLRGRQDIKMKTGQVELNKLLSLSLRT